MFWRGVLGLLLARTAAGTQRTKPVRHFPDAVLIGDQHMINAPGEPIGAIEAFGVTLDPIGLAVAVLIAQLRQVADFLLGHEHVAIRQHQQTARMLQAAGE